MLLPDQIEHYRALMQQQLDEAITALELADQTNSGTVQLDQSRVGRLSRMDAMQQQAMSQSLRERLLRNRRRLEAALERVRNGSFGLCCRCEDELEAVRLETEPAAPFCADCQDEIENKRPR
ncbi:MAG: TraR/DksA C4-type zinc finger protein [Methylomonas sp.]|uniref:TraR/DksA family transcriptional regulator n=1 Tax=Methylomonas sp. TaxID=418 RepID=UPI0025F16BA6|nr:TraR/DksA C4-type zinc finger protein [Methylomonas sp.]MCK9606296.1 TraR/DksA C4-type zinc finger protein [Methylomonas sp.]